MFRDTERNHNEVVKINVIKDIKEINEVREKLDLIDPVVISLKGRRDNYYVHTDKAYVDNLPQLASSYPLSFIKDTREHNTFCFYAKQTRDKILACAVELTT